MSTDIYQAIRALQALDDSRDSLLTEVTCADGSTEYVEDDELHAASDIFDYMFFKQQI